MSLFCSSSVARVCMCVSIYINVCVNILCVCVCVCVQSVAGILNSDKFEEQKQLISIALLFIYSKLTK
jgi:hypothetical protein